MLLTAAKVVLGLTKFGNITLLGCMISCILHKRLVHEITVPCQEQLTTNKKIDLVRKYQLAYTVMSTTKHLPKQST